jgi:hypothetical protein
MTSSTIPAAAQVHPGTKTCARAIAAVRFSAAQALEPRSSVAQLGTWRLPPPHPAWSDSRVGPWLSWRMGV